MSEALKSSRLPDLPNAGYATSAQRELTDAIMFLIRGMERDRLLLLEVVIKGQKYFRKTFVKAFKAIKADDEFADAVFGYLVLLAGPNPDAQKAILQGVEKQRAQQTWDKRLSTQLKFARDHKSLQMDILRESLKPKRTYSH